MRIGPAPIATALLLTIFGIAPAESRGFPSTCDPSWTAAGSNGNEAEAFQLPEDATRIMDHQSVIAARDVVILGEITTPDAGSANENGGSLCIIAETLRVGPSGVLCTGDGHSGSPVAQRAGDVPVEAPSGSNGGDLRILLRDFPETPHGPSITVAPGGVLCTGSGGAGASVLLVDRTFDPITGYCQPFAPTPRVEATGGDGGDAGLLALGSDPAFSSIRAIAPRSILLGRGGHGGQAVVFGNPHGNFLTTGGAGGTSTMTWSAGPIGPAMVATIGASSGGDGGTAWGVPCPRDQAEADRVLLAVDRLYQDASETICSSLEETDAPCGGRITVPMSGGDNETDAIEPSGCLILHPPENPCVQLVDRIGACEPHDIGILPCLGRALALFCDAVIDEDSCRDEILGTEAVFGEDGEHAVSRPDDGGSAAGGNDGDNAAVRNSYSFGFDGTKGGPGASASVNCFGDNDEAEDGYPSVQPGEDAGGVTITGGPAGWGALAGGQGGNAHAVGANGGKGGDGGDGGNGDHGACLVFADTEPPGNGGQASPGGAGSSGTVTGGKGGGSWLIPGKGGDAAADGGTGGAGGTGGNGGKGASWVYCADWDPASSRCTLYKTRTEPNGLGGCGAGGGNEGQIMIQGGAGGDAANLLHGEPSPAEGVQGAKGGHGPQGAGRENDNCLNAFIEGTLYLIGI